MVCYEILSEPLSGSVTFPLQGWLRSRTCQTVRLTTGEQAEAIAQYLSDNIEQLTFTAMKLD